jgi:hypothetical protein
MTSKVRSTKRSALPLLALLALACADPLIDPEVVIGLRVIGAKISAEEEPGRAQLSSGERGHVDWWVVSDEQQPYTALVVWCLAQETTVGLQQCKERPFAERTLQGDTLEPLRLDFQLPQTSNAEHWLSWIGVCANGTPSFDWQQRTFSCSEGEAKEGVYEGALGKSAEAANHNPELADDRLLRGSELWPATETLMPPGEPCRDAGLPSVRAGRTLQLRWRMGGDDREPLETNGQYAAPERESLVFTHIATEPGLERAFSALDWNSDDEGFELDYTLPESTRLPALGRSVALYLVVTDERGGSAFEAREFCTLP